ncbi:MAG TPA: GDSL-type esterase/lipase family protein [Terrimicrobiaceae bacterium]|nr:GDSL-type esterase/lipase family protein [Terrimicrobiaceae bacterium]
MKFFHLLAGAVLTAGTLLANTAIQPEAREGKFHEQFLAEAKRGNIDILFIGDSITQYWGDPERGKPVWDRDWAPLQAANFGINSDRTQHVLWRLQNGEGEGFQPKAVVLLIGTNNTGKRNTTAEAVEGIAAVVRELQKRFPSAKILLLGLLPRGEKADPRHAQIKDINRAIAKLHDGKSVVFLDIGEKFVDADGNVRADLLPDLLHPNLQGYEVFSAAIKEPVRDLLKAETP